jgi:Holliday junction resolvasome RuvABC endonuclease subunit
MTALLLALDASSTMIGWVLYDGILHDHGEFRLGAVAPKNAAVDISERCRQAHMRLDDLLDRWPEIDCIAIESPVARYGSAVIAQARVSGALLALAAHRRLLVVEVTPQAAKKALTGKGNADKALMQRAAQAYAIQGEHASDALGVALAAVKLVKVVGVAA